MMDSKSPIIDFYPIKFRLDINGAAFLWMAVNLLPFIDQDRLIKAMREADQNETRLTPAEKERNKRVGDIFLYFCGRKTARQTL
jgi:5'-3' exoribonuclease 2